VDGVLVSFKSVLQTQAGLQADMEANAAAIAQLNDKVMANEAASADAITLLNEKVATNQAISVDALAQLSKTMLDNEAGSADAIAQLSRTVADNAAASADAIAQLSKTVADNDQIRTAADSANMAAIRQVESELSKAINAQVADLATSVAAIEKCGDDGQVRTAAGSCKAAEIDFPICAPPKIANAISYTQALQLSGQTVSRDLLVCPGGFFKSGPAVAKCKENGQWVDLPECTPCPDGCLTCTSPTDCQKCKPGKGAGNDLTDDDA